jgi:hypothetical protein
MEPENSLLYSQEPTTAAYPEPEKFSQHPPHPISLRFIPLLPSHLVCSL